MRVASVSKQGLLETSDVRHRQAHRAPAPRRGPLRSAHPTIKSEEPNTFGDRFAEDGRQGWTKFFSALDTAGGDISKSERSTLFRLWGTAEQRATDIGLASVSRRGILPANERIERVLIGFGNKYRGALAADDPSQVPGHDALALMYGTSVLVDFTSGTKKADSVIRDLIDPRNGEQIGAWSDLMYDDGLFPGEVFRQALGI